MKVGPAATGSIYPRPPWPGPSRKGRCNMSNAEGPHFIDLSRPDDLKNPHYRLIGIANYCRVLLGYKEAAKRLWDAEWRVGLEGVEWSQHSVTLAETYRKPCDDYSALLNQLYKAAAPLMPEIFQKLKVLRFGPPALHCDKKTDWQAFEDDLAAILAQAEVLREKSKGPCQTHRPSMIQRRHPR